MGQLKYTPMITPFHVTPMGANLCYVTFTFSTNQKNFVGFKDSIQRGRYLQIDYMFSFPYDYTIRNENNEITIQKVNDIKYV